MTTQDYKFEVCANSVQSALAAQEAGADRVELCQGIPEGGTTPSFGDISTARKLLNKTKLHVIIRPRSGDFLYNDLEKKIMIEDIRLCKKIGVDGVVFGGLLSDGSIDIEFMKALKHESQGMSTTFHRAFDVCKDPILALKQITQLNFDRILTSGQEASADEGIPLLKRLESLNNGNIILLAGCGVNENNIKKIAEETGIHEFHFSARESFPSKMTYKNDRVSMGGTVRINEFANDITTSDRVRKIIRALH